MKILTRRLRPQLRLQPVIREHHNDSVGTFSYSDPRSNVSINSSSVATLPFYGNHAHFTGSMTGGRRATLISFTVDVADNGTPGSSDFFSIHLSNGYSRRVLSQRRHFSSLRRLQFRRRS